MTASALEAVYHLRPSIIADPLRVGICIANRLGGWGFGEPEMARLHQTRSTPQVNVYLGTAWFPAAPQGEISIEHGFLGHSKTFAGDTSAFVEAISYGVTLLKREVIDQVIVGATEAANSPWLLRQLGSQPRVAAGFLVLGRNPDPLFQGHQVAVEVKESVSTSLRPAGIYPVDLAAQLIEQLCQTTLSEAGAAFEIDEPMSGRRIVFTSAPKSGAS